MLTVKVDRHREMAEWGNILVSLKSKLFENRLFVTLYKFIIEKSHFIKEIVTRKMILSKSYIFL